MLPLKTAHTGRSKLPGRTQAPVCVDEQGSCAFDCVLVPIKLGVSKVTVLELSENTRNEFPFGLGTMEWAPGIGIVAVTLADGRSILSTAPGGSPGTLALGSAANAVVLSLHTKKLSVGPARITAEDNEFCELLTIPSLLSVGLEMSVRSRFGLTAMMPGSLRLALRENKGIVKGDTTSCKASTTSITGVPAPVPLD